MRKELTVPQILCKYPHLGEAKSRLKGLLSIETNNFSNPITQTVVVEHLQALDGSVNRTILQLQNESGRNIDPAIMVEIAKLVAKKEEPSMEWSEYTDVDKFGYMVGALEIIELVTKGL